jgi:hypothetical protein
MAANEQIELSVQVADHIEAALASQLEILQGLESRPVLDVTSIEQCLKGVERAIMEVVQPYVERRIRAAWVTPLIVAVSVLVGFVLGMAVIVRFPPWRWPVPLQGVVPGILPQSVPGAPQPAPGKKGK